MRQVLFPLPLVLAVLLVALPGMAAEDSPDDLERAVAAARDRVYPALVNIAVITEVHSQGRAIRMPTQGSGVIVSPAGHVLTNFHVAENAARLACTLPSGETIPADVVTDDPLTDLSVLKLRLHEREDPTRPIPFAVFGDSDALEAGDRVMALGNPRGLDSSLTLGVVASPSRVFKSFTGSSLQQMELSEGQPTGLFTRFIQHDALIQPGNSGGPLVNLRGEVVGINELGGSGMGFAIPANLAREVLNAALAFGTVDRGWLGVTVLPVRALGRESGALVASVQPDHPAARAGLLPGDVLLEVGGHRTQLERLEDVPVFYAWAARLAVGSEHPLTYERAGEVRQARIQVGRMEAFRGEERVFPVWGVTAMAITGPMAFLRGEPDTSGALLTGLRPGKAPEVARPSLQAGDVVVSIGGDPVADLDAFATLQEKHAGVEDLLVEFRRGRRSMVTALDMTRTPPKRRGSELAKAWLGVETQVLTPSVARALGLEGRKGLRITRVLPGTEAEKAGLQAGDILLALDGDALDAWRLQDAEILRRRIEELDIGGTAELAVLRGGQEKKVDVLLEETPESASDARTAQDDVLEYSVRDLTYVDRVENDWPLDQQGVVVTEVENGGWANVAGLAPGDLLLEIQGRAVGDVKAFERETTRVQQERPKRVQLFVRRKRVTTFVFPEPTWPQSN